MLSRTAESMFWLARYMERMDYVARLLEAASHMSALSSDAGEWRSALIAAGSDQAFDESGLEATSVNVARFLILDRDNPSSALTCIETARANARAMRIALTRDMWDVVNGAWQEARNWQDAVVQPERLPDTLEWIKNAATRFFGAYQGTMLRNDVYDFTALGTYIERADNTARILDVKYHVLLPSWSGVGGMLDYYQWTSILNAVSAARAYRWIYKDAVKPWNVAELLLIRPESPRSLRSCYDEIVTRLDRLSTAYGGGRSECHRLAGEIAARLRYVKMESVFQTGLHEYCTQIIESTAQLGEEIAQSYLR